MSATTPPLSYDAKMLLTALYVLSKGVAGVQIRTADVLRYCAGKTLSDLESEARTIETPTA